MKEMLTNNLVLKIGAVLFAILIWLMVLNIENPTDSKTLSNIPITFENTEVFSSQAKTFSVVNSTNTVSVRAYAKRLDLDKIVREDFKAVVDCNKITELNGAVKVEVVYEGAGSLIRFDVIQNETIQIATEDIKRQEWSIKYFITGSPKSGYTVGDVMLSPNKVEVVAPTSRMQEIAYVAVSVDVSGADSDVSKDVNLVFYDQEDKPISFSEKEQVVTSTQMTRIHVPILKTNQVPVDYFTVIGVDDVAEGYRYVGVECDTASVNLQGLKASMAELHKITIPAELLDVTGATGDVVKEIDITQLLPSNVEVVGSKVITVTLKVEKLVTKDFLVNKNLFHVSGMDEVLYQYEILPGDTSYRVSIRGLEEDLRTLSSSNLQVSLDVTGYGSGSHELMPVVVLDEGFTIAELETVLVVITDLQEETTAPEEGSTEAEDPEAAVPPETSDADTTTEAAGE